MLEAVVNGKYFWIPFQQIQEIKIEAPTDLRDVVWMPAHFIWTNGGDSVGLIPTRYPHTELSEDDALRLAKKTEWTQVFADTYFGLGQRLFSTDANEYALMDVREIKFNGS